MSANGAWEDGLAHVAQVATHCVGACHRTFVVLTWASTCQAGVVVVDVAAMGEAVVPVFIPLSWQGGWITWSLISSAATAVTATMVAAIATATNVRNAATATATATATVATTAIAIAASTAAVV
jgi:hypothetical protein